MGTSPRNLAPHVQAALARTASPAAGAVQSRPATTAPPRAPHVQAALARAAVPPTTAQPRLATAGQAPAPHVEAALSRTRPAPPVRPAAPAPVSPAGVPPCASIPRPGAPASRAPHVQACLQRSVAPRPVAPPRSSPPSLAPRPVLQRSTDPRIYEPSSPGSPYTSSQDEMIEYLEDEGKTAEGMKKGSIWPEKKLIGHMGERDYYLSLMEDEILFSDANQSFGLNVPGIDALVAKEKKPFYQSKLHLSESTAKLETYEQHHAKRYEYAGKFANKLLSEKERGKKLRSQLKQENETLDNPVLDELIDLFPTWKGAPEEEGGTMSLDSAPIKLIGDSMTFGVPSNIYEKISKKKRKNFVKLKHDIDWYKKVQSGVTHKKDKTTLSKRKREVVEDPDFELPTQNVRKKKKTSGSRKSQKKQGKSKK